MLTCLMILGATALQSEIPGWAVSLSGDGPATTKPESMLGIVAQMQGAPPPRREEDLVLNVGAHVRYAIPFGAADRDTFIYGPGVVVVDHNVSWADFFDPGWGLDLHIDFFFRQEGPGQNRSPGFNYGVMFLVQTDEFGGDRISGNLGNSLQLDDMTMNSILLGGKVLHTLGGGFYTDGHVAIGAVHYTSVDATFSGPALAQFRDEVLEDTWTFASQFRGHVGYRAGPVGIVFGLGFRIQAPPSEGSRITIDSGAFWTFDLDLGVELGF